MDQMNLLLYDDLYVLNEPCAFYNFCIVINHQDQKEENYHHMILFKSPNSLFLYIFFQSILIEEESFLLDQSMN